MDNKSWKEKCEFFALTDIFYKNKNEIHKDPHDSDDSVITLSSSSDNCSSNDQIKLKKALFNSIPFCIIAKRKFCCENISHSNPTNNNFKLKDRHSLNSSQSKQLNFEDSNKSLTKTQYISYSYENFCNKCDNTNIEYEYQESNYYSSKRRAKKTVDDSESLNFEIKKKFFF